MATIQERLDRLKQMGNSAEEEKLQQRLDRLKQMGQPTAGSGQAQGSGPSLQAPGSGVQVPRVGQGQETGFSLSSAASRPWYMPEWTSAPSLSTLPKPRTSQDIQTEMDQMDGIIRELRERQSALTGQAQTLDNRVSAMERLGGAGSGGQLGQQSQLLRQQAQKLEKQIAQLESNRAGLQSQWDRADQTEFDLMMIRDKDARAAVDKAMGAPFAKSVDSRNPTYRDVRSAMRYFQAKAMGDERWAAASLESADMALDRMSESQRNRLAWYVGTGDYDGAADYLNRIAPALNREQAEETGQKMAEWSQEHPIQGAAVNMLSWSMNIPAYLANTKQAAKNLFTGKDGQDPHVSAYDMAKIGSGTAQGVQAAARAAAVQTFGNETAGEVAAFLAGTGLSMGQNISQIAILGPGSLAGMSISAAGAATTEALDRGATPQQAFLVGTASGAIEAVTEKIPLDNLFRLAKDGGGRGLKATVFELLKQMGTEASEEMISEIANNIVDTAVMGDSSEFQMRVRELQESGLSKDEALRQAYGEFYVNVALAGLGGGISGGVMGGGSMALGRMGSGNSVQGTQQTADAIDRAYQAMGENGMFSPEARQAVQEAQDARGGENPLLSTGETARDIRERDGFYLPTGEEGVVFLPGGQGILVDAERLADEWKDIAHPGGQDAAQGIQMAAEGQDIAAPVGPAAQRAGMETGEHSPALSPAAVEQTERQAEKNVLNLDTMPEQVQAGKLTPEEQRRKDIQDTKRLLQESYAKGYITEEAFDQAMSGIIEQEGLAGLNMLDGPGASGGIARTAEGETYNGTEDSWTAAQGGQQLLGGGEGRVSGPGAGGQNGVLAESGPRRTADTSRAAIERQNTGAALQLEKISAQDLGISNGTDDKNVRVLPESAWDGELRETARKVRRETGKSVRFALGGIQVTGTDGAEHRVRGAYTPDGIIVQADNLRVSPAQIADHEIFHDYAQRDPGLVKAVEEAIVKRYGQEELGRMVDDYLKGLRGIVDLPETGTDRDSAQAVEDVLNEIFADAYAGINAFDAHAEQHQGAVLDTLENRGTENVQSRENADAVDRRTGPPVEQYSIDYDQDNRPFVTVEEEILDGVPRENWVKTVKDNLRQKFPNGVTVGNREIKINSQSRREMTFSEYSQWLYRNDENTYADKFRATANADEIIQASRDYVNEGLKHPRKDNIRDFARGTVQLRIGANDYVADVVVGTTSRGEMLLYDIVNLKPAQIQERNGHALRPSQVEGHRSGTPVSSEADAEDSVSASENSITQNNADVKRWSGGFLLPTGEQGTVMLPGEEDTGGAKFSVDDSEDAADGLIVPPKYSDVLAQRNQGAAENVSNSDTSEEAGDAKKEPPKKKPAKPVAKSKPIIAKRELRQTMLSLFSIPEGMRAELGAEVDRLADRALKNGGLSQSDRDAFFDRMYESGVVELEVEAHQQAGRDAVKGKKIYVPNGVKSEFGGSTEWNDFRKRAFAAGVMLTNNQGDNRLDALNEELSQTLPGIFKADETDSRAILERVVQMAEEGQAEKVSLGEYAAMLSGQEYVSENEIMDNLERQMDWALRTFTEKANLELKLRDRTGVKMAQQRDEFVRQNEARRMREVQRQAAEREQRREAAQQRREARELREMQKRTLMQLQWLKGNLDRAPSELREAFGEVLGDLDLYAVGAAKATRWSKKHGATWQDLAQMYKDAQVNDPNFKPSDELDRIVKRIDGAKVGDLDVNALQDLYKAAVGLRTEFENRKRVVHDKLNRQMDEVYQDSRRELEEAAGGRKPKVAKIDRFMNEEQLSPINMMERMAGWNPDSTFYSMAKQLEQGERDIRGYTVEANRQLADFLAEHEEWVKKSDGQGKDAIWYEIEVPEFLEYGQGHKPIFDDTVKVYMTPAQKVHMYLESQSVDNLRHMEGGRTFVDKELYAKGERQEAFAQGTTVRLAPETVKRLVSDLTLEEQAMAKALEGYYNGFARDKINQVSNELYGYDKALSKNYAPIYTNANYNQTNLGMLDVTAEGVGRLKTRVRSSTPSYNLSAMDAFERHVEQTARFVGMSIPKRNWESLLNWGEFRNGQKYSMKDAITHTWGDSGLNLIKSTIETLEGGGSILRADSVSTMTDKLFSNYISAVFGANPSIVFKQMGSIPMAAAWLDFKNFPNPAQIAHIDRGLIAKYTQELDWRTMGYSMPETKQLKDNPNWSQTNKLTSFFFGGDAITAMDGWAASVLWPWAENKVRQENPDLRPGTQEQIDSGTDPFYQKVAEEFNDAVARSQSTSDEMHQGSLRKSKNPISRTFTMFKSDSSQLYNALRQMAGEASYYKRVEDDKNAKKARRKLGAALLAAVGGYIWAEGIEFLMNLWKHQGKKYRDDEGELTALSVVSEMGQGLVIDLAGVVAGGEELADILGNIVTGDTWYGIGTPGLEQLTDVIELGMTKGQDGLDVLRGAADVVKNGGNLEEYLRRHSADIIGGIKETAAAVATYLPGLPVNNLEAYMLGTVQWISPELAAAYEDALATANKNRLSGLSGDALTQRIGTLFDVRSVELGEDSAAAISALYEAGWRGAVPPDTPRSISVNSESRELSAYQQQVYDRVWSGTIGSAVDDLVGLEEFQAADDEAQEQMLKSLYSYAGEKAKAVLFDDYAPDAVAGKADAFLAAGASVDQWAAWQGQLGALGRVAQEEGRSVKQEEKLGLIQDQDWPDEVKIAAVGTILGTDLETKSGNPSQYAKLLEAVEAGGSVDTWLAAKALEPESGQDSVSDVQRWRAVLNAAEGPAAQKAALLAVMSDSVRMRFEIADSYGIEAEAWVQLKEALPQFDENGNGNYSGAEIENAIDALGGDGSLLAPWDKEPLRLTREEKAVLWQLYTGSKSGSGNPYSTRVGKEVAKALQEAKKEAG